MFKGKRGNSIVKSFLVFLKNWERQTREGLWASCFRDATLSSSWFDLSRISLFPGRWAVGYNYCYVLFRILEEYEPEDILEFGLGESSKIISEYLKNKNINAKHIIIEQSREWEESFSKRYTLSKNSKVIVTELSKEENEGIFRFDKARLSESLNNRKFDLISIDAPWGTERKKELSRCDIIPFLPECLKKDFVIIIDDYGRIGEKRTADRIIECLESHGLEVCYEVYKGESDILVISSKGWKFCTSL